MLLDNVAEKVDCFLHIGVVEFFQLLDEHVQHRNGHLCLLSIIGVYVLVLALLIVLSQVDFVELPDFFLHHVVHKSKQSWQNSY